MKIWIKIEKCFSFPPTFQVCEIGVGGQDLMWQTGTPTCAKLDLFLILIKLYTYVI